MLKPKKRITKRQIKEDKFVTYYFKAVDFADTHAREIGFAVAAVAILIAIYAFYATAQASKEESALRDFATAQAEYSKNNYEVASGLLQSVVDKHGGTDSAKLAKFYLADSYFKQQKYDEAARYFKDYSDEADDPILKASAVAGIAACLEEKGELLEAAKTYRQVASQFEDEFLAPQNLFHSARCYRLAGDKEEARVVLREIIDNFSQSPIKNEAEMLLAELVS